MKRLITFTLTLVLAIHLLEGQSISHIEGRVFDKETNEPLPYATIGFPNTAQGTVANGDGLFKLNISEQYQERPIKVSFLGYESATIPAKQFGTNMVITLEPSPIQLSEIVVKPLPPQHYIKKAVIKFPSNYATQPFSSTAYYREKFTENGDFLNMSEGYFKSYYPSYQDTLDNQHQLLLFRKADDISEIAFMKEKREKQIDKKAKKKLKEARKEGKTLDEDSVKNDIDAGVIVANFSGPDEVINGDIVRKLDSFLDSTQFKKYRYQFENDLEYDDRKLMVISFASKGAYENIKQKGIIYIDQSTDAIIAIDFEGEPKIPVVIQPILFAMGFHLNDMYLTKKLRYQEINGIWYPNTIQWDFQAEIKKSYLFKSNEVSFFTGEQIYNIDHIETNNPLEIPEPFRFDGDEKMEGQVKEKSDLQWSDINTLKIEKMKN